MSAGAEKTAAGPIAWMRALSIPDAAVASPELTRLRSLVELGKLDVSESDSLLVAARDQLQAALARDDLPARDVVAISAELRSLHDKLQSIVKRRELALHEATFRAKTAKVGLT